MQSCAVQSVENLAMYAWGLAPFICSLAAESVGFLSCFAVLTEQTNGTSALVHC